MSNNTLTVKNDKELTKAERFTNKVMAEFNGSTGGELALTNFQKRLVQNYFMQADMTLKKAELARLKKSADYQDKVPVIWENVDMEKLAQNVVAAARIGWDPMQANHINLIPFKDNATKKYNLTFMPGYRGIELKAKKYGLDVPDRVIVELVYSTDKFKSKKQSFQNPVESFEFEITDDFHRGEIIGGFYYHLFTETPEKNKLVVMPIEDIMRRKPEHAAAEFWGGEKDVWKDRKVVGKEKIDGWFDKMCLKTVFRAAYNDITIDSQKIDDDFMKLKQIETAFDAADPEQDARENANISVVDITPTEPPAGQPAPEPEQPASKLKQTQQKATSSVSDEEEAGF